MEKEFIKFLKEHNALIPFICNLALYQNESLHNHLNSMKLKPEYLISSAFYWPFQTEGRQYWNILHDMWQSKIFNLKHLEIQ